MPHVVLCYGSSKEFVKPVGIGTESLKGFFLGFLCLACFEKNNSPLKQKLWKPSIVRKIFVKPLEVCQSTSIVVELNEIFCRQVAKSSTIVVTSKISFFSSKYPFNVGYFLLKLLDLFLCHRMSVYNCCLRTGLCAGGILKYPLPGDAAD